VPGWEGEGGGLGCVGEEVGEDLVRSSRGRVRRVGGGDCGIWLYDSLYSGVRCLHLSEKC
jgi:hypothetical protein